MILLPRRPTLSPYPGHSVGGPYGLNLALHIGFGEAGGAFVIDQSGLNVGTIHGTVAWKSSPIGPALSFDGSTNWVEVPANPSFNAVPNGTDQHGMSSLAVWVLWNSSAESYGLIYGEEDSGNFNDSIFIKSDGTLAGYYESGNNDPIGSLTLSAGQWYHYVQTYGIQSGMRYYINGVTVFQGNNFSGPSIGNSAFRGRIGGGSIFGSGRYINGAIASVTKWFRELNPVEVHRLYQDPMSLYQSYRRIWVPSPTGDQDITPSQPAIATSEAWFTPAVTGGANNISPPLPAINTGEVWFTPVVTGPVTVAKIPSGESWPIPTVRIGQTVRVGTASPPTVAIPSGEAWFALTVHNVQTISLAATIPSGEAWPTPIVEGSPQWINVVGIQSGERWFTPALNGGNQGIFLFLSGADASAYLSFVDGTCQVSSQTLGRWTATFDIYMQPAGQSQPFTPVLGQTVLLLDFGARIFSGCITQIVTDRALGTTNVVTYHCTATDKSGICDHRVVVGVTYPATDPISGLPTDVASVILAIVNSFLTGEGIVPGPEIAPGSLGNLAADLSWNFPTVTQAFDQICTDNGLVWWIDENYVLHFSSLNNLPAAPFEITETSQNWWGPQKDGTITSTTTTTNYYNKLYAVSNLNILPGGGNNQTGQTGVTDNYPIFAVGKPGIIKTFDTFLNQFLATGFNTSVGIGSVISMTVNGHAQTVVDFTQFNGQVRSGPNDYLWFFGPGTTTVAWTFQPPLNAVIVFNYVPASSNNASNAQYGDALAPKDPSGNPLGTCGSGIYEGVMQLQNVSTVDDLNAIAGAELLRLGGVPTVVDFTTRFPGLRPGQLLHVDVPLSGVANKQILITQVTGTMKPPNLFAGSAFEWQIQGTTNLDPGNWINWYERLVGRTANPLPVLQYEEAVFVLGAGASLSSGNALTNPYIVGRTGLFVQLLLAGAIPPTGQDLVLTITDGNNQVGQIVLPHTAGANQLFQFNQPVSIPIYVFSGDVLNVNASYNVLGANPTPASGVTLKVRWSI